VWVSAVLRPKCRAAVEAWQAYKKGLLAKFKDFKRMIGTGSICEMVYVAYSMCLGDNVRE